MYMYRIKRKPKTNQTVGIALHPTEKNVVRSRIDTSTSLPHIYITVTFNVIDNVNVRMRKTKV